MLRHWEQEGLLHPADVDPATGYRRYRASQLGRVRAIAQLRDLGFSLAGIRDLLDPGIEHETLESILTRQAHALQDQITEASTRLVQVQHRLDALRKKAEEITMHLELTNLPALHLWGLSTTVFDEAEISHAVEELVAQLPAATDDLVLLYDGTDDDCIVVSVGTATEPGEAPLVEVTAPAASRGASVRFDTPPASIADAWVLIDTELEPRGLTTGGIYRQIVGQDGSTTLQASVRDLS